MGGGRVDTIGQILRGSAENGPDGAAILAPGRPPLSYRALYDQALRVGGQLRRLGIGADERVAVSLSGAPEAATAFLSISSFSACAPLNPAYRKAELEFYLTDLRPAALVLEPDGNPEAAKAAQALGVPVLRIRRREASGDFDLESEAGEDGAGPWLEPSDVALLLHTSGTTSRPKLVPLTAGQLCASAENIGQSLALQPADRCLNIMPLFHIHGLMAALLSSIRARASVVCADRVYAPRFFEWMETFRPTWYTGVPTMHSALVARAAAHKGLLRESPLRFIRSCSAPLAGALLHQVEDVFEAPLIEAYGMTEASHQIASNPLPPGERKTGSVGRATGTRVAVLGSGGLLGPEQRGEIVIQGPSVTSGYDSNPAANLASFSEGWFRTGDEGFLDPEGYIYLTGRMKEMINRGGQKISPREIDEALLKHRGVRQAVAFSIPHAQLGEEVGAAVELDPGVFPKTGRQNGEDLREWVAEHLAAHKVPRVIVAVDEVPKGPTGKIVRIGLAERLGIAPIDETARGEFVAPRTPLEARIARIWSEILRCPEPGVRDRFASLGGDSLLAAQMLAAVSADGGTLSYTRFLAEGTIESLASEIESNRRRPNEFLRPLETRGSAPPLLWMPGYEGTWVGARLAGALGADQPLWTVDLERVGKVSSLAELARRSAETLLADGRWDRWRLAGYCFGGLLAFETARCLRAAGARVDRLILIDSLNPAWRGRAGAWRVAAATWRKHARRAVFHLSALNTGALGERWRYVRDRSSAYLETEPVWEATHRELSRNWEPQTWDGAALLVREPSRRLEAPALGWEGTIAELREETVPFSLTGVFSEERIGVVAELVRRYLEEPLPAGK